MPKKLRSANGLRVKINMWPLNKVVDDFDSEKAGLWLMGQAVNEDTREKVMFNEPGQLLTALSRWNIKRFQELKSKRKSLKPN
jgi:hypothetical protein